MKILVIGGGGREHALAWKLAQDSCNPDIFCAPGNAGTAGIAVNLPIQAEDVAAIVEWAKANRPDLTVVGPEAPLCAGVTDQLEAEGLRVFGPSRAAARMEGSKIFAKEVMVAAGVPTARGQVFSRAKEAIEAIRSTEGPIVVKADGLAAGKGVAVCNTMAEAEQAVLRTMDERAFGDAGDRVLIEECLQGEEASILALVDGEHILMLASSQDHKRVFNNDEGPNTGGMGAYSPAPIVRPELWPIIREQVFERTLSELKKRNIVYRGVLYAGLMIGEDGPQVLEFNCRFGDPETQVILPRIKGDLVPALNACIDGTLTEELVEWRDEACVSVVMASGGYPGPYEKGLLINGLPEAAVLPDLVVFHAGTRNNDKEIVTDGGRVLAVTALGHDLRTAMKQAYLGIRTVTFDQAQYRTDIGARALVSGDTT